MIEITYDKSKLCVVIKGHAGYATMGQQDPVCAGVSALAYTLGANVMDLGDRGMVVNAVMRMLPGDTEISCRAVPGHEAEVLGVFDAICMGFELLSGTFEKNIHFEAVEG